MKTPSAPATPNPYYDPAAAARLAELNAAESDDAPAPESSNP